MTNPTPTQQGSKTADYTLAFQDMQLELRLNTCTDQVEVNGVPLSDALEAKILMRMHDRGFKNAATVSRAMLAIAWDNRYHPIKKYFSTLPGYDGKPYIEQLATYFDNPDGTFSTWLRKWMIGSVAKIHDGAQNPMLILDGEQGIGKSLFVRWLASGLPNYFTEGTINPDDKDTWLRVSSKWIWEIGEAGGPLTKAERGMLKNLITQAEITVRRPYGKNDVTRPAMASFIGTVNNDNGVLDDPTGSRRFLISEIKHIDWTYNKALDVNMLWAEAYAAWIGNESHYLTPAENQLREQINKNYEVTDSIELVLIDRFRIDPNEAGWWTSTLDIATALQESNVVKFSTSKALQMAMASRLKSMGLEPQRRVLNGQKTSGYTGLKDKNIP